MNVSRLYTYYMHTYIHVKNRNIVDGGMSSNFLFFIIEILGIHMPLSWVYLLNLLVHSYF